ncbi:2-hydroxyacid dehydrogenase [Roseomonas sp. OT10]|uniref:2-hydroxyacid dehydrogenase n=1 Tax=Roseomonas cutis TaxID=2897332 RepID=UPI001E44EBDB|nr:2-hydroxyacid dehydrogenase [Roseomonas sp. OT10]UFN48207.1 2-hydroxyacid dehydrogenase [Roseomonas sp. OT10]
MRVAFFSTKPYDRRSFTEHNAGFGHELTFLEPRLTLETTRLAEGFPAVCAFVNDTLDRPVLEALHRAGTRIVALRSTGFNNVDLAAAAALGMPVVRATTYSPHSVAEFAVATLMALNRHLPRAYSRTRDGNFSLDGLLGFDMHGRTIGVVGTGKIGSLFARIMRLGFGCEVLARDVQPQAALQEIGVHYVDMAELAARSDVISLHCPLTPETRHIINAETIAQAKPGVLVVNTSRGALVDTRALIRGLKSGRIGGAALDVYEQEADFFYEDLSNEIISDEVLARLMTFPNVVVTSHQAFFTREALRDIATLTLRSLSDFEDGRPLRDEIRPLRG